MNIIFTPMGSAGDVHPFIGLALALKERGHQITFVVNGYFQELTERVGLTYVELGTKEQFVQLARHPDLWHPRRGFPYVFNNGIAPSMRDQFNIIAERYAPGDTMVIASCLAFGSRIAQEKIGIPLVTVHLQPAVMWSKHQSPTLPNMASGPHVPGWLKQLQFRLGEKLVIDGATCKETNRFRAELGLAPMKRTTSWWYSPQCVLCLFPEWYAPRQPDWPDAVVFAGFPLWDERGHTDVSPDVEEFLRAGPPPIVFTPGSAMLHGKEFFQTALQSCRQLGRRGILLSRFREHLPASLPDDVRHFDYVPFSQVLPHSAALVHHGGIGTTAQAFAAGIPQLIKPMSHDQPDNAARVKRLGVGDWLKPSAFNAATVTEKLNRLMESDDVRRQCREVSAKIRPNDGLAKASRAVEMFASHGTIETWWKTEACR